MVEIVTLTGTLAHACEHGVTTVALGDVVDEFHDDDRLADARTTECSNLATLGERTDEVDDLDAGFENLRLRVLLGERRSGAVNRILLRVRNRTTLVGRLANDVEDTAENALAHWD